MKCMQMLSCTLLTMTLLSPVQARESREDKQHRLDGACEVARQTKLAPIRKQIVEECVANKEMPNRKECERFYSDYGQRTGRRAALFYDLPECVTAFNYLQGNESPD